MSGIEFYYNINLCSTSNQELETSNTIRREDLRGVW